MNTRVAAHVSGWCSGLGKPVLIARCGSSRPRATWDSNRSLQHLSPVPSSAFGAGKTHRASSLSALPASDPASSLTAPAPGAQPPEAAPGEQAQVRDHSLDPFRELVKDKRFACTLCGKCCTGSGEVWVSDKEAEGIAAFLEVGLPQFYNRYTKQYKRYKGFHLLKNKLGPEACVFLQADNKCGIHSVRPGQCSTYPWWPELMDRPRWDLEKENICEGFDHADATEVDVEEAAKQLRQATIHEQLRMLSSTKGPKPPTP